MRRSRPGAFRPVLGPCARVSIAASPRGLALWAVPGPGSWVLGKQALLEDPVYRWTSAPIPCLLVTSVFSVKWEQDQGSAGGLRREKAGGGSQEKDQDGAVGLGTRQQEG